MKPSRRFILPAAIALLATDLANGQVTRVAPELSTY